MIDWLVQSTNVQPDIAQGFAPPGLLSREEAERLKEMKTEKRRRDWLLGRWTSKLLVQTVVREHTGQEPPLKTMTIGNDASGAPQVTWEWQFGEVPISLSISHSGDRAFCAAKFCAAFGVFTSTTCPVGLIGADIEKVEARSPGFVEDYFTETEQALVNRSPLQSRDVLITATWSAKEAVLKALHLGLTVDTRSVTCSIEPVIVPPQTWTPFQIDWDTRRLNRWPANRPIEPCSLRHKDHRGAGSSSQSGDFRFEDWSGALPEHSYSPAPILGGWWRILDGYVLTLVNGEA